MEVPALMGFQTCLLLDLSWDDREMGIASSQFAPQRMAASC
jgi:hypothetical protein